MKGQRPTQVMEALRAEFGMSERAAWEIVRRVRDRWDNEAKSTRTEDRAAMIAQVRELVAFAWEKKAPKEIRGALGLLADVQGLRLRAVVLKDESGSLSDEEREAIAALLHARPGVEKPPKAKRSKPAGDGR